MSKTACPASRRERADWNQAGGNAPRDYIAFDAERLGILTRPPGLFSSVRNARLNRQPGECVRGLHRERAPADACAGGRGFETSRDAQSRSSVMSRKILSPGALKAVTNAGGTTSLSMTRSRVRIPPGPHLWTRSSADRAGVSPILVVTALSLCDPFQNVEVRHHGIP